MASKNSTTLPACNRLLQKKWEEKSLQQHKLKLKQVRATVDTKAPHEYKHIRNRVKQRQIEEEKLALIQKHNKELAGRMQHIMTTTGRVDHRNSYRHHSLNHSRRQRELDFISKRNKEIAERLEKVKPLYDTAKWENEYKFHEGAQKRIGLFPVIKPNVSPKTSPEKVKESEKRVRLPAITDSPQLTTAPVEMDTTETKQASDEQEEIEVT
ncbi:sperm axonemal maintenance protein CFAP97D1-like [Dysidea avara]|uniref:sperm axonemal maintenance protein CFAP97D1-like n=1 Tax=Dysidea avara TaxID=196820 RepID=UPI00332A3E2E